MIKQIILQARQMQVIMLNDLKYSQRKKIIKK